MTTKKNQIEKFNFRGCIIWIFAVLFYFYEFMIQVSPGVMVHNLMKDFQISAGGLGNLSAYYFYSYAGMQLFVGIILDRWGPRKLLSISSIICAIGCYLFSQSTGIFQAELSRFIIGIGSASAVISCFKLATAWFPVRYFGVMTGFTVMTGMLGAIFGEAPLSWITQQIGWRFTMMGFSISGCILSLLIWSIVRDKPALETSILSSPSYNVRESLSAVLKCPQTWLTSIYGGLMFAPTTALGALWGVSWMCTYYDLKTTTAANIISFLFLGWVFGSPLSGILTNYFGRCKVTMQLGTALSFIIICLLIFIDSWSVTSLGILWFLFGIFSSGFLPFMTIIRNQHSYHHLGTAMGFGNAMNMIGGAALQPLIGWLLDQGWKGEMLDGVRSYPPSSYKYALLTIPALIAISYVVLFFIKENNKEKNAELSNNLQSNKALASFGT
jgi:MFS family permease